MLKYFPTPYEGESFYSILCRYYVMSGKESCAAIRKELFGELKPDPSALFPNVSVSLVASKIPDNIISFREILLNHTTFKYYTRLYSHNEREEIIKDILNGRKQQRGYLIRNYGGDEYALRFCPECIKEDREKYGEAYYHTAHQLRIATVCHKHHCKLEEIECTRGAKRIRHIFLPLDVMDTNAETDFDINVMEDKISELANEYLTIDDSYEPPERINNIYTALLNMGYMKIVNENTVSLETCRLMTDLEKFFGSEIVKKYFGDNISNKKLKRLREYSRVSADRYILLQIFTELTTEEVFSSNPISDKIGTRIKEYAQKCNMVTLNVAAKELGLKNFELIALSNYYMIPKFWMDPVKKNLVKETDEMITFAIDSEELDIIKKEAGLLGYVRISDYMLDCVRYVRDKSTLKIREKGCIK